MMTTLLDSILVSLVPPFALAKLEGDVVFAYANEGDLDMHGPALRACLGACYRTLREHLERTQDAMTCSCDACSSVLGLDLKFFPQRESYVDDHDHLLGLQRSPGRCRDRSADIAQLGAGGVTCSPGLVSLTGRRAARGGAEMLDQRSAAAVHESGHTILAAVLGIGVLEVVVLHRSGWMTPLVRDGTSTSQVRPPASAVLAEQQQSETVLLDVPRTIAVRGSRLAA